MMSMSPVMHPIWQTGAMILALTVIGALLLQAIVHRVLPAALRRDHTELGSAIFAVIGTTYAVLLAFMATTAWEQHSTAEALARHEADLLGNIHVASTAMPAAENAAIRDDVARYLRQVISTEWPAQIAGKTVAAQDRFLADMERRVFGFTPQGEAQANAQKFLMDALTDVASARRDRRLAADGTIPDLVWVVLLAGGGLLVCFSFVLGAPHPGLHALMTAALVASGALVLLLIIGLSSPFHGAVSIAPDAYAAVLAEIAPP